MIAGTRLESLAPRPVGEDVLPCFRGRVAQLFRRRRGGGCAISTSGMQSQHFQPLPSSTTRPISPNARDFRTGKA